MINRTMSGSAIFTVYMHFPVFPCCKRLPVLLLTFFLDIENNAIHYGLHAKWCHLIWATLHINYFCDATVHDEIKIIIIIVYLCICGSGEPAAHNEEGRHSDS